MEIFEEQMDSGIANAFTLAMALVSILIQFKN